MSRFQQQRTAKLRQLAACRPFVAASLCVVPRRCGKPTCKCMRGEPHTAHVLTFKVRNKTRTIHVPKEMVQEVQQWVTEHKRIKNLLQEISDLSVTILQRHVPAKRAAVRAKPNSRR